MTRFRIDDGVLYVGEQRVDLPLPVAEGLACGDGVAVRLEVPAGQRLNRNVFFVEPGGAVRWQIEESPHGTQEDKPFMNIWSTEDGDLIAGNWNGVDYEVDLASGSIEARAFPR